MNWLRYSSQRPVFLMHIYITCFRLFFDIYPTFLSLFPCYLLNFGTQFLNFFPFSYSILICFSFLLLKFFSFPPTPFKYVDSVVNLVASFWRRISTSTRAMANFARLLKKNLLNLLYWADMTHLWVFRCVVGCVTCPTHGLTHRWDTHSHSVSACLISAYVSLCFIYSNS